MAKTGNSFKPESLLTKTAPEAAGSLSRKYKRILMSCVSVQGPEPRVAVDSKNNETRSCSQELTVYVVTEGVMHLRS